MKMVIGDIVHVPGETICLPAVVSEAYGGMVIDAIIFQPQDNRYEPKLNYEGDLRDLNDGTQAYPLFTWHKPGECKR